MINIEISTNPTLNQQVVSARELYDALGYDLSNWKKWYVKNIQKNQYATQGIDWEGFVLSTNGNETMDFHLSLDFAKEICMMARTEKGKEIRLYFIQKEKELSAVKALVSGQVNQLTAQATQPLLDKMVELMTAMQKQLEAQQKATLLALPVSEELMPEESMQSKVVRLVGYYARNYCNGDFSEAYKEMYNLLYTRYRIDLKAHKKLKESESWMEVANRNGYMDTLHVIISNMIKNKGGVL